ncbi:MAG: 8-oxoguanine deaminase [Phycisphaerae bacterium]
MPPYNVPVRLVHDTTVITPHGDGVRVLPGHSLAFDGGRIVELRPAAEFEARIRTGAFNEVIRADCHLTIPGLVNTHHHLYQSITRCLTAVQDKPLFHWLLGLYERWRHLDYQAVKAAAQVSIAELLLHGCTTTSDHFYMFPRGRDVRPEAVLEAAEELGIRLHLCRGAMTLGRSRGGLPPDDCVEDDADVLRDCQRVLESWHDPSDCAMRRIDLAPCSPFNCTPELIRDTVWLARQRGGVLLHTHLAETLDEERYCLERYGCRPVQFLRDLGFFGRDVYLAHCVHLLDAEIAEFAAAGVGVCHAPTSNMRLGSGIAPIRKLLRAGVKVGLAVDGSSSNDGGNLLGEIKQALLAARLVDCGAQRAGAGEPADGSLWPVVEAFKLATIGGAAVLNRPALGHLNPGAAADFALFRADDVALAGAVAHDPLAALVLCDAPRAERVFVAGREVVHEGRLVATRESELSEQLNRLASERFRAP